MGFQCELCLHDYSTEGNLRKHKREKHNLSISTMYECKCGKTFKSSQSLNAHYRWCLVHRDGKEVKPTPNKGKVSPHKGKKLEDFAKNPESTRNKLKVAGQKQVGRKMSDDARRKMSESRLKNILSNNVDSSGRRGHRGHYDGIYFHSSWELAFYVYEKEINNKRFCRNMKWTLSYTYNGKNYKYAPDFIFENSFYEIKGYLFSDRDKEKFKQTSTNVIYLFKDDIKKHLEYCKNKYGKQFWKKLYAEELVNY